MTAQRFVLALLSARELVRQGSYRVLTPKNDPHLSSTVMIDGDVTTFVDSERLPPELVLEHLRGLLDGVVVLRRLRHTLSAMFTLLPVAAGALVWCKTGELLAVPDFRRAGMLVLAALSGTVVRFMLGQWLRKYARFI